MNESQPPIDNGRRLAEFDRSRKDGLEEELRIALAEFQGHMFMSVRLWRCGRDRQWWPQKG
jgi:hypothetical protein